MKPHKHAEVIKAWADGAEIEWSLLGDGPWKALITDMPAFNPDNQYRVKPAAPKWPQTTMTEVEQMSLAAAYPCKLELIAKIANVALAHACEAGQVVPASVVYKTKSQADCTEKKLLEALQAGVRREHELGNMLHEAVAAVHELDPNRKVRVPTPKPTVYVASFKSGEIVGRDTEERDIAIAINVRAACLVKHPGFLSNDDLNKIISTVK